MLRQTWVSVAGLPTQPRGGETGFVLRREPLYHKLQYAKTPRFDVAAAVLGVGVGAVGAYLGLSSVGSMGVDLGDLTVLV